MPANLPAEWYILNEKIKEAKSLEEKIELIKKLIGITPKHKGTENVLADLRRRLAKYQKELERRKSMRKGSRPRYAIEKTGDILISLIGFPNSGKSLLLKSLTNASVEVNDIPYSTVEPKTGVVFFEGVQIQLVEIPSFFVREHLSIAHNSDLLLLIVRNKEDVEKIKEKIKEFNLDRKNYLIVVNSSEKVDGILTLDFSNEEHRKELLRKIIKRTGIIRIFTKPPGKPVEKKAIILKKGSTVKDAIKRINEEMLETFEFARIYDNSKFSGRKVGLDYVLKDGDILEVHTK